MPKYIVRCSVDEVLDGWDEPRIFEADSKPEARAILLREVSGILAELAPLEAIVDDESVTKYCFDPDYFIAREEGGDCSWTFAEVSLLTEEEYERDYGRFE